MLPASPSIRDAASGATSYLVYFGSATSLGPLGGEQSVTGLDFERLLEYDTRYCWRVNTKNAGGTTFGEVWCFTTEVNASAEG